VHVVDRRGLTAVGAVAVALVLGAAGGLVDVLTGQGLRTVFAVCFIVGCAFAALRVHREDLVAAVVMPPLVYVVIALLAGAFSKTTAAGGWATRQALELATSLVLGAPVLLTATGLALVIAGVRAIAGRTRQTS
jgi:cation transporter-like permease